MRKSTFKLAFIAAFLTFVNLFSVYAQMAPNLGPVSSIIGITRTAAFSGVNVVDNGGATIIEQGLCVSTSANPTTENLVFRAYKVSTTLYEPCVMTGLTPNTHYYVRGYATNSAGTNYSAQSEFTTSSNDVEAIWSCNENLTSTVTGGITASDLNPDPNPVTGPLFATVSGYNQNTGGDGTGSILLPAPTGLVKLAGTSATTTYSTGTYMAFSVTSPTQKININRLSLTLFGYKSTSINIQLQYSLDNFATAGIVDNTLLVNDASRTAYSTDGKLNVSSANPSLTTSMGKENISWKPNIVVNSGQTLSLHLLVWGKANSTILMKNLIVSGTTNLGTGIDMNSKSAQELKLMNNNNELKVENANDIRQLEIISVNGKVISSFSNTNSEIRVKTDNLSTGVYIVKAIADNGVLTGKFIK